MKIALASDWHLGLTKMNSIRKQLKLIAAEKPDVVMMLGDFNGGFDGPLKTSTVLHVVREFLPAPIPLLCVVGNHDYWSRRGHNSSFVNICRDLQGTMEDVEAHFFDVDGLWRDERWPGLVIGGHTGWYGSINPGTNDSNYMPLIIEDLPMHRFVLKQAEDFAFMSLSDLRDTDTTRWWCSHMPLVDLDPNWLDHAGNPRFGELLQRDYGFTKFFNGHAHQLFQGPLRYEAGSDYGSPKHLILKFDLGENT